MVAVAQTTLPCLLDCVDRGLVSSAFRAQTGALLVAREDLALVDFLLVSLLLEVDRRCSIVRALLDARADGLMTEGYPGQGITHHGTAGGAHEPEQGDGNPRTVEVSQLRANSVLGLDATRARP